MNTKSKTHTHVTIAALAGIAGFIFLVLVALGLVGCSAPSEDAPKPSATVAVETGSCSGTHAH